MITPSQTAVNEAVLAERKRCVEAIAAACWPHYASESTALSAIEAIDPDIVPEFKRMLKERADHINSLPPSTLTIIKGE